MADTKELLQELNWIRSATEKEIQDEQLILNEQLDEIAEQLRFSDGKDSNWHRRAVDAARHKRKRLKLIARITGKPQDHVCLSGELKNKFDTLKSQNLAYENKILKLKERIVKLEKKLKKKSN